MSIEFYDPIAQRSLHMKRLAVRNVFSFRAAAWEFATLMAIGDRQTATSIKGASLPLYPQVNRDKIWN